MQKKSASPLGDGRGIKYYSLAKKKGGKSPHANRFPYPSRVASLHCSLCFWKHTNIIQNIFFLKPKYYSITPGTSNKFIWPGLSDSNKVIGG